jgi:branched-chain amino acid transport system ATP-binding protein
MLLRIENLEVYYGKAKAIEGVSLDVDEGEIVALVGANGAGKTTILRAVSGSTKPASGVILFGGNRIDGVPAHRIVRAGIAQIPAGRMIFANMTVLDNLKIGAYLRKDRQQIREDIDRIYEHFPVLKEKQFQSGGELSGGQQQMLAIARALMARPRLLLMDEPSVGLSPILVAEISSIIRDIHSRGMSILLVEQNCRMALKLAKRAYVMELGKISLAGDSAELADNEMVKRCYLGG